MKKLNKIQKIGVMILAAFMMLSTFVACNAEIEDTVSSASVTFAPGIPKALNQSGEAGSVQDKDVTVYHWKYQFALDEDGFTENGYKNFSGKEDASSTGLGTISNLIKGKKYYFALRGYTTSTDESTATLIWEGKTDSAVAITAKNTTVSITVKPMGKGNVFFDITSTVSDETKFTGITLNDGEKSDIYFITYAELSSNDDNTSATNTSFTDVTYSTDTDGVYMSYKTTSESGDLELAAGQYLFTIEQQKWNNGAYETVDGRGQVLIVTVEAGVKTYVKGSLDSSISTYVATNDIKVSFSDGDPDDVKSLIVTSTAESGSSAIVYDNSRIYVYDGQYVQLSFTQIDGTSENLKVYVNKYALDLTTDTNNYCADSTGKVTHIMKCADANKIKAYGAAGDDYIVTIRYNKQSMSFTIVGKDSTAATAKNTEAIKVTTALQDSSEYITLQTLVTTENVTIENAKITNADAYSAAEDLSSGTDLTDVAEQDLTLTLKVTETESTESSSTFEIGMDAELVYKDAYGQQMKALEGSLHDFDNYVEISVQIETGLKDLTVKHSGNAMSKVTTTTDFTSANDTTGNGMYCYDSTSGKLYIATKSFSKFAVNFKELELQISQSGKSDTYMYLSSFRDSVNAGNTYAGCTVTLLKDVDLSDAGNWTPIGTSSHPFSGIFDGNNKTISNLTIAASGTDGSGLFGYIKGSKSGVVAKDSLWITSTSTFNSELINQDDYDCQISNLNISATVSLTSGSIKYVSPCIGTAEKAYIKNITILENSTVNVYKYGAGIVGLTKVAVVDSCTVSSNVSLIGGDTTDKTDGGGHIGGIVAYNDEGSGLVLLNCTNNASINAKYGYNGGILAYAGGNADGNTTIYNCVNNGDIECSGTAQFVAGIVGNAQGAPYIIDCKNYGKISGSVTNGTTDNFSGIASYAVGAIYSCFNYGNISGSASYIGGIVGKTYEGSLIISNSANNGNLTNTKDGGQVGDIIACSTHGTTISGQNFATVAELQSAISGVSGTLILKNLTVTDKSGTLELPSTINNLISDSGYFDGLNISACSANYITVTIPDFEYTLHGDASGKTLGLSGANNITTFASDCKLNWLRNYGSNGKYIKESGCVVNTIHGATGV